MAKPSTPQWTHKHLLGIEDLSVGEIRMVLDTADEFFPYAAGRKPAPQVLEGRTIMNLFIEDSTRTRTSFTFAAERLGARVFQFHATTSSLNKKESLADTARNVEAMGLEAIVIRHPERNAPHRLAEAVRCSVLNAGDDSHEHPTQALLDLRTILAHLRPGVQAVDAETLAELLRLGGLPEVHQASAEARRPRHLRRPAGLPRGPGRPGRDDH